METKKKSISKTVKEIEQFLQYLTKYFAKSNKIKQNWTSAENFDTHFFI